jgi:hypothetical protein
LDDSPTQQDRNVRARHDYSQATLPALGVGTQTVHTNDNQADGTDSTSPINKQEHAVSVLPSLNNANTSYQSLGAAAHINGSKKEWKGYANAV